MRKLILLLCLAALSLCFGGCQTNPAVPTDADPVTTSPLPYTAPPETETTAPPDVPPPEPYWKESALLAENGEPRCTILYDKNTKDIADRIAAVLAQYGNAPEMTDDLFSEQDGTICLELAENQEAEYYVFPRTEHGIAIHANSRTALSCAADYLCARIEQYAEDGNVNIPVTELAPDAIFLSPAVSGATLLSTRTVAYETRIDTYGAVSRGVFETYLSSLKECGYSVTDRRQIGNNLFAAALCPSHNLFLSFFEADETATVVFDRTSALLPSAELWDKIADTTLVQLAPDYRAGNFGMGYVILLQDGSFVLIDGGTDEATSEKENEHTRLYSLLTKLNPRKDRKIVIRAWFLTGGRYEHATLAKRFAAAYGDTVSLQYLCCSAGEEDGLLRQAEVTSILHHYAQTPQLVLLHSGLQLDACGAQFDVLFCDDDIGADSSADSCDRSAVVRMTTAGQTVLFTSDLQKNAAQRLADRYGESLKCDILQMPCHGTATEELSPPDAFYDAADPSVILWPNASGSYEADKLSPANTHLLQSLHVAKVFPADTAVTLILPYEE